MAKTKKPIVCKKLKGLMAEHEITIRKLSRKIGISENSLTLKINGKRPWWFWEMLVITKEFGFSEVKDVFPEIYDSILKAC
ncbi:helix-turn-helix domain-containing protein [Desulforamulus ruminis]|uniref:helix-turn-helix domain-containing protein n=1 Tax=Desulforamulus ruminis TaxID=1564 RepID=UPI0023565031|nr:helix-turn-helix transcriptional regulator [Desulforamulus ruminis]